MTTEDWLSEFDREWSKKMGKDGSLLGSKNNSLKVTIWAAYDKGYFEGEMEKFKMNQEMQKRLNDLKYGRK